MTVSVAIIIDMKKNLYEKKIGLFKSGAKNSWCFYLKKNVCITAHAVRAWVKHFKIN